jgi:hypothetical protein
MLKKAVDVTIPVLTFPGVTALAFWGWLLSA